MSKQKLVVPDIGDFDAVEIIDVMVKAGDTVAVEDSLITLESDKAAMDVPSEFAGRIAVINVSVGDKVSTGDTIGEIDVSTSEESSEDVPASEALPTTGSYDATAEILVLGAGVGGYTAAFRAADLGKRVVLVERWPVLGGVCLNVGCIPSKALLHAARVIEETRVFAEHGIRFGEPDIDIEKLRGWKESVVKRLTGGLNALAKRRRVQVVHGVGRFAGPNELIVTNDGEEKRIRFQQCIIAAGSEPAALPGMPDDPRIMDSTGALELNDLPNRLLVIGGGIIGLEMACVYDALDVNVTVVELTDSLIPECDRDLVRPLEKRIRERYENIFTGTRVESLKPGDDGIYVTFSGGEAPSGGVFDRVLVAIGRRANGDALGLENAGVVADKYGLISVDNAMRTNVPHIFAIGDIVGQPMLAHKASHQGKVAAEVACGEKRAFDARVIPSVAYTDPEIAWAGLTETEAREKGIRVGKGVFPWAANGRSLAIGRDDGLTRILFDKETGRVLGAGIVGPNAGDLISEVALAIEMGADAEDIGLTIHPHPTLSETVAMAAEAYAGTLTDL